MNSRIVIIAVIVAAVVAVALAFWFVLRPERNSQNDKLPENKAAAKEDVTKAQPEKTSKHFTITPAWGVDIAGDGSVSVKGTLSSAGLRLTKAPSLAATEQFEIYVVHGDTPPELVGTMKFVQSEHEKYIWAAGGPPSWFGARSFIITKRKPSEVKPGTKVGEALIPAL